MSDWVDLVAVAELEPDLPLPVKLGRRRLAVYLVSDGIYVTDARCTHGGADLTDGYFDGRIIECPLHQGCFDVRDGRALYAPATRPLATYPARIVDQRVEIRLPDKRNA